MTRSQFERLVYDIVADAADETRNRPNDELLARAEDLARDMFLSRDRVFAEGVLLNAGDHWNAEYEHPRGQNRAAIGYVDDKLNRAESALVAHCLDQAEECIAEWEAEDAEWGIAL